MNIEQDYLELVHNDSTVWRCLEVAGLSYEESLKLALIEVCKQKAKLIEMVRKLEAIAPKRYETADGQQYIWRAPEHLIPVRKLGIEETDIKDANAVKSM